MLRGGHRLGHSFLDIRGLVGAGGERGLLSIAFPPDYPRTRRFYAYYTDRDGNIRVDEFRRRGATRAARGSRRGVIEIPPPLHGPRRQPLRRQGRPRRDLQLRPAQPIPLLLRHAQREAAADRDRRRRPEPLRGARLPQRGGRRRRQLRLGAFEGNAPYTEENGGTPDPGGTTKPIMAYGRGRDGGSCTLIGDYVMSDPHLPSLRGRYVYTDYCSGELRGLVPHLGRAAGDRRLDLSVASPTSFGQDGRGRLYVCSAEGPVYRLVRR